MYVWRCGQDDGSYSGFDSKEFTSQSGGKAAAVRHIKVTLYLLACRYMLCRVQSRPVIFLLVILA